MPTRRLALVVPFLAGIILLLAIPSAPLSAAGAPDLDQALAERRLDPVRTWVAGLDGEHAATPAALRARAWLAFIDHRDPEAARELARQAAAADPQDPILLTDLATLRLTELDGAGMRAAMGLGRELRELYEQALELDPEHVPALVGLIGYHQNVPRIAGGRRGVARDLLGRLEGVSPSTWHQLRGGELRQDGELEQALESFRKAAELGDGPAWGARFMTVVTLQDLERWDEAFQVLESLVAEFPLRGDGWYQLGRTSALSGQRPQRGIEALEQFLELESWPGDPGEAPAWWRIGQIHEARSDQASARQAFQRSLELDPDFEESLKSLENMENSQD